MKKVVHLTNFLVLSLFFMRTIKELFHEPVWRNRSVRSSSCIVITKERCKSYLLPYKYNVYWKPHLLLLWFTAMFILWSYFPQDCYHPVTEHSRLLEFIHFLELCWSFRLWLPNPPSSFSPYRDVRPVLRSKGSLHLVLILPLYYSQAFSPMNLLHVSPHFGVFFSDSN